MIQLASDRSSIDNRVNRKLRLVSRFLGADQKSLSRPLGQTENGASSTLRWPRHLFLSHCETDFLNSQWKLLMRTISGSYATFF